MELYCPLDRRFLEDVNSTRSLISSRFYLRFLVFKNLRFPNVDLFVLCRATLATNYTLNKKRERNSTHFLDGKLTEILFSVFW